MKTKEFLSHLRVFYVAAALFLGIAGLLALPQAKMVGRLNSPARNRVAGTFGDLPLNFERNQGQVASPVEYLARGEGYALFLMPTEALFSFGQSSRDDITNLKSNLSTFPALVPPSPVTLRMKLMDANPLPRLIGQEELPGKVSYLLSDDPSKWRVNIPTYEKIAYRDVYPGVDMVYYGNQQQLEYDFIVAPGADPAKIVLDFDGTKKLEVNPQGHLVLNLPVGHVQMQKPFVYQDLGGIQNPIPGEYVLLDQQQVGVRVGAYDVTRPLMIDPVLLYSSYLGGFGDEEGLGIALDNDGNIFIAGITTSLSFPMTSSYYQGTYGGGAYDGFVAKLDPAGSAYLYTTYFGGSDWDTASSIAVDASGNAYITGSTQSTDFPTKDAFQASPGGGFDTYVAKLAPDGSSLVYSTYLGGTSDENGADIALDSADNVVIVGQTQSADFPTANAIQSTLGGSADAFIAKLNTAGSVLVYSTYLGGTSNDSGDGIAVDSSGNAFMIGTTLSTNFPTQNPLQAANAGLHDAFIAKVDSTGAFIFSTYLGGNDDDGGNDVAVDSAGDAYLTGYATSTNFPTVNPAQPASGGAGDAFIAKINSIGSAWLYSTYLGGSGSENSWGIAVGNDGSAYITGNTTSMDFPVVDPLQSNFGGGSDLGDAFVTKFEPSGQSLTFSSYLGGSDPDRGRRIAVISGVAYLTGQTQSADFPLQNPLQPEFRGAMDAFLVKLCAPHFTVTSTADSGAGTLRQAVADVCPGGTIDFDLSYPATITLTKELWLEKNLTITGPGASNLLILGDNGTNVIFYAYATRIIALSGLTISNPHSLGTGITNNGNLTVVDTVFSDNEFTALNNIGVAIVSNSIFLNNHNTCPYSFAWGGAISNGGDLVVTNSTFSGNTARDGGGIFNSGGTLVVANSVFSGNSTTYSGASIANYGSGSSLSITDSIFSDNAAGTGGAGIRNDDFAVISNSTFSGNTADSGGGAIYTGGVLTVSSSTFSNNSAIGYFTSGGSIDNSGTLTIDNSTFFANSATRGGGINSYGGTLTIINSTFSSNTATQEGGGIFNVGTLNYSNTILANNGGGDCSSPTGAIIGTNTNNLVEDGSCSAAFSGDPKLSTLANNGGSTQTIALLSGSPAIDAGDDATCADEPVNNLDQRGAARPIGAHCDIGAYEYQTSPGIIFTHVPPYGIPADPNVPGSELTGQAQNVLASDYYAVIYIFVPESLPYNGGWWIKPRDYDDLWKTPINPEDNSWISGNWSGLLDGNATIVEAYLVPKVKTPPTLPPTREWLNSNAGAKAEVNRTYITISGNAGVGEAVLTYTSDVSKTVTADNSGNYSINVPFSWSGTITPSKPGYIFNPSNRTYENVLANMPGENYAAAQSGYTLNVTSDHGMVTKNPDQDTYSYGDVVQLTATPNFTWAFTNWTGDLTGSANPASVTIYGNTTVTANYKIAPSTLTAQSNGTQDGWIIESSEKSNKGGTLDAKSTTFRLGDDVAKKQYLGILSFSTKSLPDNAVITKVTLKVKKQGIVGGGNPVTTFQGFLVDIKRGTFGTAALQVTDFQALLGATGKTYGPFKPALVGGWYSFNLTAGSAYINKAATASGLTQIRLRFKLDDNNNTIANYLSLYSSNAPKASQPQLIIEYYVP